MQLFTKVFGTKNDREISALSQRILKINSLESRFKLFNNKQLCEQINKYRIHLSTACALNNSKENVSELLNSILHEVFAIVREVGKRVLNMRHYDVQLMGGIAIHEGKIAEMKTGEGKTFTATLPVVLNSLTGLGVHIVTVNDYLASRDAEWMGRIYKFLNLDVGVLLANSTEEEKRKAYQCSITYGQNNEFGFDYLRDNMKFELKDYLQRGHQFAIVDEVDSILIDEARTPLIISGETEKASEKYKTINSVSLKMKKNIDFSIDEKTKSIIITELGNEKAEKLLGLSNLYDSKNISVVHHLNQALKAHHHYKKDVDYVIVDNEALIVDEHTGRVMTGRRWSDGLHQAIEAKENLKIEAENQTLATITFQNYFKMYKKLSGMTGTAATESEEFAKIYNLDVLVIPTNQKMIRIDEDDQIYKTENEKLTAIINDIINAHKKQQPILVGTVSVEKSEILSKKLDNLNIKHVVLNAKKHRDEAGVIAQAGRLSSVTIATSMAGRGTDIILGGDPEFMARTAVADKLSTSGEQIAEFAFLSGRPDLITPQPESKDFQEKAIELYSEALLKFKEICKTEKEKVKELGGLRIIGTERHESRRIDNQLRGRAGRQGDPGLSRFYLALEDSLIRIFASDKTISTLSKLGMKNNEPIEHPWVSTSIANAQKRVESFYFDSRKQLIDYDNVMNQQRTSIYALRCQILGKSTIKELIQGFLKAFIVDCIYNINIESDSTSTWKVKHYLNTVNLTTGLKIKQILIPFIDDKDIMRYTYKKLTGFYQKELENTNLEFKNYLEKLILLETVDEFWRNHLQSMDYLREGIHLTSYAQKDPKQEYKKRAFILFKKFQIDLRNSAVQRIFKTKFFSKSNKEKQI